MAQSLFFCNSPTNVDAGEVKLPSHLPSTAGLPPPPQSPDEHGFGRELDSWETNWDVLHAAGAKIGRPLFIENAVSVITTEPFHIDDLREAGRQLMEHHAALRARIHLDASSGRIAPIWAETIEAPDIEMSPCRDWEEALRYEQLFALPTTTGPLWRMRVLTATPTTHKMRRGSVLLPSCRTWLLGVFHHAIMDGMARQQFWKDFLNAAYKLARKRTMARRGSRVFHSSSTLDSLLGAETTLQTDEPLPAPVSSVMPSTFVGSLTVPIYRMGDRFAFYVGKGLTMFFRKIAVHKKNPFSAVFPAHKYGDAREVAHTSVVPLMFDASTTKKLIQTCKQRKVPLNSVLTAVAAAAIAQMINREDRPTSLYTTQAISTRRWMHKKGDEKAAGAGTPPITPTSSNADGHQHQHQHQPDLVMSMPSPVLLTPSCDTCRREGIAAAPSPAAPQRAASSLEKHAHAAPATSGASSLPRLGCFTCLMGLGLEVPAHALSQPDRFWEFASMDNRRIHSRIDRPDPTDACGDWHVVTNFLKTSAVSGRLDNMVDLVGPEQRPSVFLISNTGNWDTTDLRKGKGAAARGPRQPTMLAGLSRYPCTPTCTNTPLEIIPEHDHDLDNGQGHEEEKASAAATEEAAMGRWRGDFEMEIESSWSCVSQHGVGNSLFSHNLVTISGRLNWSLQYESNLVNRCLAEKYAKTIHDNVMKLLDLQPDAEQGFPAFLMPHGSKAAASEAHTEESTEALQ